MNSLEAHSALTVLYTPECEDAVDLPLTCAALKVHDHINSLEAHSAVTVLYTPECEDAVDLPLTCAAL